MDVESGREEDLEFLDVACMRGSREAKAKAGAPDFTSSRYR